MASTPRQGYSAYVGGRPVVDPSAPQFPSLPQSASEQAQAAAVDRLNRLISYDRDNTARSRVHDAQSDFDYSAQMVDRWKSVEEKAVAYNVYTRTLFLSL